MVSIMPFAYMVGVEDSDVMEKRVATFYAGKLTAKEMRLAYFIASGIAALFGAIHCIAWSFDFPSQTEQFLWHVSSIAITCLPLGPPLVFGIEFVWENWVKNRVPNRLNQQMMWIFMHHVLPTCYYLLLKSYALHPGSGYIIWLGIHILALPSCQNISDCSLDHAHTSCVTHTIHSNSILFASVLSF